MKKSILNLGKKLHKQELKNINGGLFFCPDGSPALDICENGGHYRYCPSGYVLLSDKCPY